MGCVRRFLLAAVLLMLTAATPSTHVAAQGATPDGWVPLGPPATSIDLFAVSSAWPGDPFIFALERPLGGPRTGNAFRTFDGGATWESITGVPANLSMVWAIPSNTRGHVLFGLDVQESGNWTYALARSPDSGITWDVVLPWQEARPQMRFSPAFDTDGTAFAIYPSELLRTRDGGESWQTIGAWTGQRLHDLQFSPDYGRDQTLLLSASSGQFHWIAPGDNEAEGFRAAVYGNGDIYRSADGGESWTTASQGLEINGQPFRHVESITFSPTYAQDRTVFTYAWGAWTPSPDPRVPQWVRTALFVSQDEGQTWTYHWEPFPPSVWQPDMVHSEWHVYPYDLQLSPRFAENGVGMLIVGIRGDGPSSTNCRLLRTSDYGHSWLMVTPQPPQGIPPDSCRELSLSGYDGRTAHWIQTRGGYAWYRSLDGGASHSIVQAGGGRGLATPDGALIRSSADGVWMLPPTAPLQSDSP